MAKTSKLIAISSHLYASKGRNIANKWVDALDHFMANQDKCKMVKNYFKLMNGLKTSANVNRLNMYI